MLTCPFFPATLMPLICYALFNSWNDIVYVNMNGLLLVNPFLLMEMLIGKTWFCEICHATGVVSSAHECVIGWFHLVAISS